MCLSFLSFNVSAFVRKLTMGIFAAAFDARESAHLRPRITKRPNPRSATLPIHNVQHREKRKTIRHCCRRVIASETLTSTPNPLPARSRLLSLTCRGRPAIARYGDGGADRDRTGDPLLAKQVLSQLSYRPRRSCKIATSVHDLKRGNARCASFCAQVPSCPQLPERHPTGHYTQKRGFVWLLIVPQ